MVEQWTISEIRSKLLKGAISAKELIQKLLSYIENHNSYINAYLTITAESALKEAEEFDNNGKLLEEKPLGGVPIAIKDCLCTRFIRTTCASKILENFVPPYDATCVEKLRKAGAIIVGKTNMDEFAMGSTTEHSAFGPTRNPWDTDRVPGGSSGGSAAAVASGMAPCALGTDTGGSIRLPSFYCGVLGLKPTYGRVSRYGLIAFASSLDQAGPIARTVEDLAILAEVISGYDPKDTTSVKKEVPRFSEILGTPVKGIRIGIPKEYFQHSIDPEIERAVEESIKVFRTLGVDFVEVSLPHTDYGVAAYYIIAPAEASSNLARYDGVKYGFRSPTEKPDLMEMYLNTRAKGFGAEVKRRIMLGTYALSAGYYDAYYIKASKVRRLIQQDFLKAFEKCDALITPVAPLQPFKIGEKLEDPLALYLVDVFTLPASLAGIPGMSVPCGLSSRGLPVGFQLLGKYFDEEILFRLAYAYHREIAYSPQIAILS